MKRIANTRIKLYKKLQEYYELAGVKQKPNVKAIMKLHPTLVEEEIRRVDEALDDLRYFEPKRRREDRKEGTSSAYQRERAFKRRTRSSYPRPRRSPYGSENS